ncbi:MAG TPA: substrate-binding domain-containing protein [Armatimonadota bacterium]|nr:substrate-binding domain-containing protein [Armatimonadota bacterium]
MNCKRLLLLLLAVAVVMTVVGCEPKETAAATEVLPILPKMGDEGEPAGPETSGEPRVVTVYVPCGLTVPITEAIQKFEAENPDIQVDGTFDTGIVNAKNVTEKDERPDLFVSPGKREIELLEVEGIVDPADKIAFGYFELIVAVPKDNPQDIHSLEDLVKADVITMPDPENNSIGVYGEEALRNANLWDTLMPDGDERIVLTDKPITAYDKVAAGKSEAALMFENCPMKTYPDKLEEGSVRIAAMVDKDLYERPMCVIGLLKEAPNPTDARAFMDFLLDEDIQAAMKDGGLKVVTDLPDYDAPAVAETATDEEWDGETIEVRAYYPGNEGHNYIREIVEEVAEKYGNKVDTEFIDFTSDDGYPRWRAAGMSCGGFLVNGEQTLTCERDGKDVDVFFGRGEGGEWNREDLFAHLDNLIAE